MAASWCGRMCGSVRPPVRPAKKGTHRQRWRLRQGRALRGSTCGSRPLTPAMPERLRGRLWQVATKRIEYGPGTQGGKDTAPRRRMFIGHESATVDGPRGCGPKILRRTAQATGAIRDRVALRDLEAPSWHMLVVVLRRCGHAQSFVSALARRPERPRWRRASRARAHSRTIPARRCPIRRGWSCRTAGTATRRRRKLRLMDTSDITAMRERYADVVKGRVGRPAPARSPSLCSQCAHKVMCATKYQDRA